MIHKKEDEANLIRLRTLQDLPANTQEIRIASMWR